MSEPNDRDPYEPSEPADAWRDAPRNPQSPQAEGIDENLPIASAAPGPEPGAPHDGGLRISPTLLRGGTVETSRSTVGSTSTPPAATASGIDKFEGPNDPTDSATPPRHFGVLGYLIAGLCWALIIAYVGYEMANPYDPNAAVDEATDVPLGPQEELLGMTQLGLRSLIDDAEQREQIDKDLAQTADAEPGPYNLRLARAIVVAELQGPEAALERLREIDRQASERSYVPKPTELARRQALERLFEDLRQGNWEMPAVGPTERQDLVEHLGWYGELALAPSGAPVPPKEREALLGRAVTLSLLMGLIGISGFGMVALGIVALVTAVALAAIGKIRLHRRPYVPRGTIYLETFLLWMAAFVLMPLGLLWVPGLPRNLAGMLGSIASLSVLVWPTIRGVSWSDLRSDLGLRWQSSLREVVCGLFAYLAGFPLIAASLVLSLVLIAFFGERPEPGSFESEGGPSHPIQQLVADGSTGTLLFVFVTAAILAPLIEEIVFRGVLYRHLREVTGFGWRIVSVAFSAALSGLIFAAIHPQGIFLIPALGTLGVLFALAREWRGALLAPMTMHAIHNGMLVVLSIVMMRMA
ncbi:MAG TPA: type II CAAX endopeptidase family protein [Pirellulaceae bacterium]|nr:type II CAAX endopeptidase family protein [Pirellulaceae bacterium]